MSDVVARVVVQVPMDVCMVLIGVFLPGVSRYLTDCIRSHFIQEVVTKNIRLRRADRQVEEYCFNIEFFCPAN